MDLPSNNMYDIYRGEIWEELGPLDPNWFEILTAQTSVSEGNVSDQDDLCANQEGNFKTPLDRTAADSQLFSTPKIFRHNQIVSPETEDEQSFTTEQEKGTLPWAATKSPSLFQTSKQGVPDDKNQHQSQDSFDLLHTPHKSPVSYAKHISESLGAQINPDISWTSSFNTPPAVPSTLILSKTDESPCPVSVPADKNVVFVRKLFPSLSNASTVGAAPPTNNETPAFNQGAVSPEADETHDSPQTSLNQSDGAWQQKLPDAIEDGEVRSAVSGVLEGAETVLSIFFANSSSALRKVKPGKIKRKQIVQTKEPGCNSADISTANNAASTEEGTADQEPGRSPSSLPVKTGDTGTSQWSPLSLSEIPPCTVASKVLTELQSDSDFSQLVRPPVNITDSGFIRKKRTFIYTVGTLKPQVQGKETPSQKMGSSAGQEVSVKQLEKAPDEADCCSKNEMQKQAILTEENLPPSVQAKVQDVDMSQLCRDFAQDFSQMSDSGKLSKAADDTRCNFSPSACLSAMKQAKQKAREANHPHEGNGVGDRRHVSTTSENDSIIDGTMRDSGFHSAVGDTTHTTASSFVLPCTENAGHSRRWSGFKTDVYRTAPFPSTTEGNGKVHLGAEAETRLSSEQRPQLKERQSLLSGRETELHIESTSTQLPSSAKGTVGAVNCIPLNGQIRGSLPEKTAASLPSVCASGFKTASNKGIRISSASLERAKHLFEETEGERSYSDHATKRKSSTCNGSVKSSTCNSDQLPPVSERFEDVSCQLTASQKADVTELCTLLEEADSQFEFTQTAQSKQLRQDDATSPQKAYKEIDPDFLTGIDFDDSFNSDAEQHLANPVMPDRMTSGLGDKTNAVKKDSSSSDHISEATSCRTSTEPEYLHRAEHTETSKLENKNPLTLGVAFKTAGGNVMRVSKTCLRKARALFADLEENLAGQKSPDKENSEMDAETKQRRSVDSNTGREELKFPFKDHQYVGERILGGFSNTKEPVCSDKRVASIRDEDKVDTTMCQSGFHMASGKGISISAKYIQHADAFFNGCDIIDHNDDVSVKHKRSVEPVAASAHNKTNLSKSQHLQRTQGDISEERVSGCSKFENVNAGLVARPAKKPHPDDAETKSIGFNSALALKNAVSYRGKPFSTSKPVSSPLCTASKNIDSAAIDELSSGDGFCTASGKKVAVSADALKRAECLLNEIHALEDTSKQLNQKENASRMARPTAQIQVSPPRHGGFQTASGKGVSISSAALKKAKSLFSECEEVEHKIGVNPLQSEVSVRGPPLRNGGFLAASGKQLALSSEAFQKAKALFSDISFIAEIPDTRSTHKKEDNAANREKIHSGFTPAQEETDALPPQNGGFQTASGKEVAVSSAALRKAKSLFSECVEHKTSVKPSQSKIPVHVPPPRNGGFLAASGKPVALSSEALEKAKALFSDISFSAEIPAVSHTRNTNKKQHDAANTERIHCGFTTAGGGKVLVSQKNLLKAKHLLKEFDDFISADAMQEADAFFKDCSMDCNSGMSVKLKKCVPPVSGSGSEKRNMSKLKPDQRLTVSRSEEPGSGCTEFGSKQVKQRYLPPENGGFQTASGKGVAISSEALKKAKSLFSECEGVDDKIGATPPRFKIPVPGPPFWNGGFLAASGKPVALSSEALQKAKALFSDIGLSTDIPAVPDRRKSEEKHKDVQNNPEKVHCGFTTAGGAKVHVSEESLLKANNLLKEFADGECHDSYSASPHDTRKLDQSEVKDVKRTSNSNLTTASVEDMSAKGSASLVVKSFPSLQQTDRVKEAIESSSVHGCTSIKDKAPRDVFKLQEDSSGQEMPHVSDSEINQTSSSKGSKVIRAGESSVLNFQSLYLTGCTETQQKFLAQEALDCTKALLEDEGLAGQSLSVTLENMPLKDDPKSSHRSAVEDGGRGKRSVEDADMTGQPPLKRRLVAEFDRTIDGPRGSTLRPVNSCPNGVMKDRGVFKYSVSLHPNITRPHSSGKSSMEARFQKATPTQHSTPGDSRSARSKMPAFVPPFIKHAKSETCKNTALKDNIRAPSAFVPPFKKQRTVAQESSSKPQEDKHHDLFAMPSNSRLTPPSKKTQGASDVIASVDTTSDNMMAKESLPVACGSVSSAAEASHVDETFSRSQDMFQNLQNIELARDMQDMRIRKKKRQTVRPLPGSLFLAKTSGVARIPLKAAVNGKTPARYTQKQLYGFGVHEHVSEITSETAESFRFSLLQFIKQEVFTEGGGVQLADGGWLIPSNDGTAGKEEFYRALCDTPGVDPKLISEAWVYNHYRWIVWKQASMEKSFPQMMGSLCLTPEQVLLQLKYRYDVEVDHSRRPALRKITEKDDTAAKTLILCVCEIVSRGHSPRRQSRNDTKTPDTAKVETPSAVVWLTDGWYAIKAQLDEPLTAMLHKGRLAVGGKLIIHGAQLVGSQDACPPLEAPESLMLKISANSSRPARWDAKLGFHRDPRPFLLPVSSLYSNGGPVGCVDIIILRSYPIQWMERKPDGGVVFRSVRAEEKEVRRYNSHKQKSVEILFAKIQAEFEKEEKGNVKPQRRRQTISHQDIASLQDGEELYEAVGDDPAYLEAHLSERQLETLHTYRRTLMEKKQAELQDRCRRALEAEDNETSCPKRDVAPVWRLCIADSVDQPGSVYQMNLWRPSSDLQSLLKEGCRYKVYNLTASDGKKRSSTETVQLTGTKKTQFQDLQASQEWLAARFQQRFSTSFVTLQNPEFQPLCGEVDLSGYVISVVDEQGSSPAFYLADGNLNFVKVRCFSSLSQSGLEDVVKPRVLLALSNLQLRGQSMYPTPVVYAGDLTVFSTNPKEVHLQESLSQLKNLVQCQENFFLTVEEKLSHLIRSDGLSFISPALQPQTPASTANRRQDAKTSVISQKPIRSLGSFTPVSRNPPAATPSTEKDPKSLKRRRALDYLSRIPSPPPLSHLGSVASPCVHKTFNPPRRSATPSTLNTVQTPAHKPTDSLGEDEWVNDEELAMIDTQALRAGDLL